jgi:hypothetical protein
MIKLDISKALPSSALVYLNALVPGAFLGLSVFLGNPSVVQATVAKNELLTHVGYYVLLLIALFFSWIIGDALLIVVRIFQAFLGMLYRTGKSLGRRAMLRVYKNKMRPFPNGFLERFLYSLYRRFVVIDPQGNMERVLRCKRAASLELLKVRYGIQEDAPWAWNVTPAWDVWAAAMVTRPLLEDVRGDLWGMMTHASGWAGVIASCLAPALRNRYYLSLCAVFIIYGVLHDKWVAKRLSDPVFGEVAMLRSILKQLQDAKSTGLKDKIEIPTNEGTNLSVE